MRYIILFFTTATLISSVAFGQENAIILDWSEYFKKIEKADSLYKAKQYQASARAYSDAFIFNNQGFSSGHRYQAARAWAMVGKKDSAYANLKTEVESGFYNYKQLTSEKAFKILKRDTAWKTLASKVKYNQQKEDEKLGKYKPVKIKLEKILNLDQQYRKNYFETWKKFGDNSTELIALKMQMRKVDKSNLKYVTETIDKYGWIGYDTIGLDASNALFLVIQHGDSATQEKYLPLLRSAVKQKKAAPESLALLEDRVLVRRGEKQIYGTQVQCDSLGQKCWVLPIADEKNVDNRRKEIGMRPLAIYLKSFGIEYKLPD